MPAQSSDLTPPRPSSTPAWTIPSSTSPLTAWSFSFGSLTTDSGALDRQRRTVLEPDRLLLEAIVARIHLLEDRADTPLALGRQRRARIGAVLEALHVLVDHDAELVEIDRAEPGAAV